MTHIGARKIASVVVAAALCSACHRGTPTSPAVPSGSKTSVEFRPGGFHPSPAKERNR
jgi:hypothetical protein